MGVDGRKAALSRLFFSFSLSLDRKCKFPVFKCNSGSNFKKKKKVDFLISEDKIIKRVDKNVSPEILSAHK